jgi:hypothetical protein
VPYIIWDTPLPPPPYHTGHPVFHAKTVCPVLCVIPYKHEKVKEISSRWILHSYHSIYSHIEHKTYINVNINCITFMECVWNILQRPYQENQQIQVRTYSFEIVEEFMYLGTCLTSKNEIWPEIEKRIATADRAHYALHPILKSQSVYRNTKIIIYKTLIRPIITYGAEAWTMSSETCKGWPFLNGKF